MYKTTCIVALLLLLTSCVSEEKKVSDNIDAAFDAIEENRRISEENDYQRGQERIKQLQESDSANKYKFVPSPEE